MVPGKTVIMHHSYHQHSFILCFCLLILFHEQQHILPSGASGISYSKESIWCPQTLSQVFAVLLASFRSEYEKQQNAKQAERAAQLQEKERELGMLKQLNQTYLQDVSSNRKKRLNEMQSLSV